MTKFNTKSLLIIVVILLIGITALWQIQRRASPAAAWFSDAWQYRKAINIGYTGATALTDFQVSVDIGTSALIAAGKMKSDCSDIRFTDQNGNLLNYWIEENNPGCNQITDTKIWIKVPSVKTSGTNIYIYYGNSSATSFQDGKKVFLEFDDFNTNTINNWTIESNPTTTYSISGGTMSCVTVGGDYSSAVFGSDYTDGILNSRFRVNSSQTHGGFLFRGQSIAADNSYQWILRRGNSDNRIQRRTSTSQYYLLGGSGGTSLPSSFSIDTWFPVEMRVIGTSVATFFNNASAIGGTTNDNTYSSGKFGIECYDGTQFFDYIFVRKYAASDPTKTLLAEERSLAPIAHWSFDEGVGTTAYDSSSNRNNGIFGTGTSAPIWQTEDQCVVGKCLKFDSNDYVSVGDFGESPMTLSLWIKPSTTNDDQRIISNIDNSKASSPAFSLRFQSNKIQIWGTSWKDITTSTIPINKWTHIVVIVNSSGQAIGFVNGKQEVTAATDTYNFYSLGIGSKFIFSGNTAGNYYNGFIDEPKIYAYARTAAQIKQDYRAGLAGMKTQKGSSVAMGGSSAGKSLSDGLVGYWKMDEGVGTSTVDTQNKNITGTTVPTWSYGKYGNGLLFNGTSDKIEINDSPFSDITAENGFTISSWINLGDDDGNQQIVYAGNIQLRPSVFYTMTSDGWQDLRFAAPNLNSWHHLVGTFDGEYMKIYIDGIYINQKEITKNILNPNDTIRIGGRYDNAECFSGYMDEIRFYNRALSPSEVTALYEYAPGPVAYYDFEEGIGTTAFDKSGNGNNAVWSSNNYATGKIGKAGNFISSNYATLKNIDSLDIMGPITISAWVYPTTMNAANIIFSRGGGSANNCQYLLNIESGSPRFYMGNTNDLKSASAPTILTNKWHYLTGIFDGTKTYIYVNGVGISGGSITNQTHNTSYASRIGAYSHAGTYPFAGLIDEVKIYNYARTQKQILQDMHASAPVGGMSKINKPIAHYKFDEGYGTVANNSGSIGSTINGTFGPGSSAPTWVTGKSGKGLSFDGNDYISSQNNSSVTSTQTTVTAWVKFNALTNYGRIVDIRDGTNGLQILYDSSIGKFVTKHSQYQTGSNGMQWNTPASGIWYHITSVFDSIANTTNFYVNGVSQIGSTFTNVGNGNGVNKTYIGARSDLLNITFLNGIIDEVKIYNYALSEDEIKQDYNQGATAVIGKSTQTIGATTTSLDYCIPGDTSHCAPPIAEYNFEEGVGTTAYDKSGNGNHCYTSNSPLWVSGKTGGALQFNGSNQRCTKTGGVTIGQITAQAWVYRTSSTTNQGIIRQQNSFILSLKDDTIQLGGTSFLNTGITIPLNSWQHVAWTNNGNNNILFINGQEKWRNSGGTLPNNTNDLNVAYDNNNWWWGGKIDSVKIYNYARTPAQIAYDYNKGAPIAHWKMDECQGTTINDSSGNNNHGTLTIGVGGSQSSVGTCQSSGAWYNGRTGKINSAMSFDGTDDYVGGSFSGGSTFTFSAWVKNNNISFNGFVGYTDSSGRRREIYLSDAGRLRIFYGLNKFKESISNSLMNDLAWHHVVGTYDDSSAKIYIDGKETSLGNELTTSTQSANIFYIGRLLSGSNYFNGLIDDVRIYNYALTAEQVKSVYNGGSINFR